MNVAINTTTGTHEFKLGAIFERKLAEANERLSAVIHIMTDQVAIAEQELRELHDVTQFEIDKLEIEMQKQKAPDQVQAVVTLMLALRTLREHMAPEVAGASLRALEDVCEGIDTLQKVGEGA